MKTKDRLLLSLLLFGLILFGCALPEMSKPIQLSLQPTPIVTPIFLTKPLAGNSAQAVAELSSLRTDADGSVAVLSFTPDGSQLLSVHVGDGMLRRWDLRNDRVIATQYVGPVDLGFATFDRSAHYLAMTSRHEPTIRLWDSNTGGIKHTLNLSPSELVSAIAISPDGNWLYEGWAGGFAMWDTASGSTPIGGGNESLDLLTNATESLVPAVATMDTTGEWVVAGYTNGSISVDVWDEERKLLHGGEFTWLYYEGEDAEGHYPRALALHPTRRWLVAVVADTVQVWDTNLYPVPSRRIYPSTGKEGAASLAFSPDGSLLAIGTSGGWQIRSVPGFRVLAENDNQPVTAVTFSPDGSLFAWGDAEGTVHVWGVPQDR